MIQTRACDILEIEHPIMLAPLGSQSDAKLVAAVSEAGGLGVLAVTWRGVDETIAQVRAIRSLTRKPFGVNLVLHLATPELVDACFAEGVGIISSFRGDPTAIARRAHEAGALSVHQVTTLAEAEQAVAAGVDVVVAQGREGGGHIGPHPLWSLLPDVVAAAGDVPVLAAGGIVDGEGLAVALTHGAAGVAMGTRFLATPEAIASDQHKQAIVASRHGDTVMTPIWDLLWGEVWPGIKVRSLRNRFGDEWTDREDELVHQLASLRPVFQAAEKARNGDIAPMLAGEGAARIGSIRPAADIVRDTVADAERIIRNLAGSLG